MHKVVGDISCPNPSSLLYRGGKVLVNSLVMKVDQMDANLLVPCRNSSYSEPACFCSQALSWSLATSRRKLEKWTEELSFLGSVFIYLGTLATNYISLYNLSSWVKSCNWSLVKNITNSNMAPKYFVMLFPFPFFHSSVRIIKMSHVSEEEKNT